MIEFLTNQKKPNLFFSTVFIVLFLSFFVMSAKGRLTNYINYRLRVVLDDGRSIAGTFLAYDSHMNLCIADAEEFRSLPAPASSTSSASTPSFREQKRTLGFVLIRGECVVSVSVEGPPPDSARSLPGAPRGPAGLPGTGTARPLAKGVAVAGPAASTVGLAGNLGAAPAPAIPMPPGMSMPPMPPGMSMPPMPPGMGMPPMPPGFGQ